MSTGSFTALAGDFGTAPNGCRIDGATLRMAKPAELRSFRIQWSSTEKIPTTEIASLEALGQVSGKSFGSAAAAGIAGGLLLGGVGAVAGVLSGGNRNAVTFKLELRDGRACVGSAKPEVFQMLQAAAWLGER